MILILYRLCVSFFLVLLQTNIVYVYPKIVYIDLQITDSIFLFIYLYFLLDTTLSVVIGSQQKTNIG